MQIKYLEKYVEISQNDFLLIKCAMRKKINYNNQQQEERKIQKECLELFMYLCHSQSPLSSFTSQLAVAFHNFTLIRTIGPELFSIL